MSLKRMAELEQELRRPHWQIRHAMKRCGIKPAFDSRYYDAAAVEALKDMFKQREAVK